MLNRKFLAGACVVFGLALLWSCPAAYAQGMQYIESEDEDDELEAAVRESTHGYLGMRGVGFHVLSQTLSGGSRYVETGRGFGIIAGLRLGPVFSMEWEWDVLFHDSAIPRVNGHPLQLDRVYSMIFGSAINIQLPTTSPLEPYLQAGGGWTYFGADYCQGDSGNAYSHVLTHGPTFTLGGGMNLWLGPVLTINTRVAYRGMYLRPPGRDGPGSTYSDYVSAFMFDIGGAFHL